MNTRQINALRDGRRRAALYRRAAKAYAALFAEPARVMACSACGSSAPGSGWLHALREGWAWTWRRGVAVFLCPAPHEARPAPKRARASREAA